MVRLRSASWVLTSQVASLLISFPMSILLARTLGPAGKGELTVAQLIASLGVVITSVGLPSATTYFIARKRLSPLDALFTSLGIAGIVETIVLFAWMGFGASIQHALGAATALPVILGAIALVPALVSGFMGAALIGLGSIRNASIVNVSTLVLQLVTYLGLWASKALTPTSAILGWLVTSTISAVALSMIAIRAGRSIQPIGVRTFLEEGVGYGLLTWISGGLGLLVLRVDMLLLTTLKGTQAVGVYSIAVTFAELLFYVPTAVSTVLVPKVASERSGSVELVMRITRLLWPLTAALGVGLSTLASFLIVPIYGAGFAWSIPALWALVPGTCFSAMAGAVTPYFAGIGRPQEAVRANGVALVANVVLNLILIPNLGVVGASLASTVSYGMLSAVMLRRFSTVEHVALSALLMPRLEDVRGVVSSFSAALRNRIANGPNEESV